MSDTTVFINGRIYATPREQQAEAQAAPVFAECMVVADGLIRHVGARADQPVQAALAAGPATTTQDLAGRYILPGFVDGHLHLLMVGQALQKISLDHCKTLADVRAAIAAGAAADATSPRLFARGWTHSMTPDGVDCAALDDLDPRPIFVDTKDLHSTWCNSAALAEICARTGLSDASPDPAGGTLQRDAQGRLNGVFNEGAVFQVIWPFVASVASMEEKKASIRAAIAHFSAAGYTGMVDMAMDDNIWDPLISLREEGGLGAMRIAAYWLMKPNDSLDEVLAQVDRAAEMAGRHNATTTPDCRVVGIKVICDGIVDACTASLTEPYANGADPDALWPADVLHKVVAKAHRLGLQVALHAIGDRTVTMVIDVLEANTDASRRPRVEHLELASPADAARLGKLGITASVQPVHADPAILRAWPALLGADRCRRAFAYREFVDGGAVLALGSDAPTAPHVPLPNLYVATTRRSYRERELQTVVNPEFALTVAQAISGATHGSAYSCFADGETGSLEVGKKADFVVVDMEPTPEKLIDAVVQETWFEGRMVFKKG
ncbi:amidohydrolase family protein [Cordyceps fumosorosea ARSEF 2679]|uniref:Amidohydrolase family protein n=1 Tax=Cordyceps fumosorosea (strain ARSEF 2679) TaxID=1081104 RepID=A0A167N575_CORFA|nr:amidohydrolase family protein [Cordyceps fumosorosea ARSEF 2679]OAA55141.1 amidohydrolase family protein [Cordyceps fumosorosea ARSEF 2679]